MGLTEGLGSQNGQERGYKKALRLLIWGGLAIGYAYGVLDYAINQDYSAVPAGIIGAGICSSMFCYELWETKESLE